MINLIYLYSGTPGSGKSLHSISTILNYLRFGKVVIANFPIKFNQRELKKGYDKRFIYMETLSINPTLLIETRNNFVENKILKEGKEGEILCVFDECSIMFNPRDFSRHDRMEWINFLSQHRHYGFDIVMIAQMDRMIDRQIRGLIENEVRHRKLNNLSFPFLLFWFEILFKLFCAITHLSFFVAITYWFPVKMRLETRPFLYTKGIANHYSTFYDFRKLANTEPESGDKGGPDEDSQVAKNTKYYEVTT